MGCFYPGEKKIERREYTARARGLHVTGGACLRRQGLRGGCGVAKNSPRSAASCLLSNLLEEFPPAFLLAVRRVFNFDPSWLRAMLLIGRVRFLRYNAFQI